MGLASLTAGTRSDFLGKVVDFNGPFALKDRILTQNDDSSESTESPFRRLMDTSEHPNRQTPQQQQTNTLVQTTVPDATTVPDTPVQLKTNTKEHEASMPPPLSSIPHPSRTISEEKTLDTLDDVKEKDPVHQNQNQKNLENVVENLDEKIQTLQLRLLLEPHVVAAVEKIELRPRPLRRERRGRRIRPSDLAAELERRVAERRVESVLLAVELLEKRLGRVVLDERELVLERVESVLVERERQQILGVRRREREIQIQRGGVGGLRRREREIQIQREKQRLRLEIQQQQSQKIEIEKQIEKIEKKKTVVDHVDEKIMGTYVKCGETTLLRSTADNN